MINIDPRRGSGELAPYFKPYDVPVQLTQLELSNGDGTSESLGDMAFFGNGVDADGEPTGVAVGIERKRVGDLVQSMRSNRLSGHQLNGLCRHYAFVFILVEGLWRCGKGGVIEVPYRGTWKAMSNGGKYVLYREVDNYLTTLKLKAATEAGNNLIVDYTGSATETAAHVVNLYKWFNDKSWDQHRSHETIYAPFEPKRSGHKPTSRRSVGVTERMAAQIPGVGRGAKEIADYYGSPLSMTCGSADNWMAIETEQVLKDGTKRKVKMGLKRALRMVELMTEGK
jgi:ERCC4-type nuclease